MCMCECVYAVCVRVSAVLPDVFCVHMCLLFCLNAEVVFCWYILDSVGWFTSVVDLNSE